VLGNSFDIVCVFMSQIWSDVAVKKEISKLPLLCQNRINGCEWTGSFEEYIVSVNSLSVITLQIC